MHDLCREISVLICKDSPVFKGSVPDMKGVSSPGLAKKKEVVATDRDAVFTCFWL